MTVPSPTGDAAPPGDESPGHREGGREPLWLRMLRRPCLLGSVLAVWFYAQSLAPSLLVRSWLYQGVLAGVSIALGYAIGLGLTRFAVYLRKRFAPGLRGFSPQTDKRVRLVLGAAVVAYAVIASAIAVPEHRWTWDRLGYERASFWYVFFGTVLLAAAVALVLFMIGSLLKFIWKRTTRVGALVVPAWIAGGLALILVGWAVLASLNNFVLQRTLDNANAAFSGRDLNLDKAPDPPTSSVRSGGPESEIEWAEAGHEGRRFLTRGATTEDLAEFATGEVTEPVRVYVGRASADTIDERVDLAMAELERFGAFEREALLVIVPTGTGWINEQIVQPVEYFHDGDVATVAVQYSHLPSPLAFLSEAEAAGDSATALFEAIEQRAAEEGSDAPTLYIGGESLGSFGGSKVFDSLADSKERVDGAVWVGPPETMHLRREAEKIRKSGSLQIRPVVGEGEDFVFVNRPGDFTAVMQGDRAHSVFLQQADDPIVWWDWDSALHEPDWLEEPLDPAVNPYIEWTPVTTFLQLALDMGVSNNFDENHGHKYGTQPLSAWYAILRPVGWDLEQLEELREKLAPLAR